MSNIANLSPAMLQQLQQLLNQQQQQLQIVFPDVNDRNKPLDTIDNLKTLLTHYGITIKYNMLKREPEIVIPNFKSQGELYNNAVLGELTSICARNQLPVNHLNLYITTIAHENEYHPVRDWIDEQVWDGVSRLQSFYDSVELAEPNPLKETLLRKWALSAVASLYHPNFSCEGVLTFQGSQGLGKTSWILQYVPEQFRTEWVKDGVVLDMRNKDTVFKALGSWITELGELDATFKKSDIEALKAFITERQDKLRSPYDRVANTYRRQTVFYASVNEVEFLQDSENRRFWVLVCKKLNWVDMDIGQFWAEMKQMYMALLGKIETPVSRQKNNEYGWFLSPTERDMLSQTQEVSKTGDPIAQLLQHKLMQRDEYTTNGEWLNITAILEKCNWTKPGKSQLQSAGKWLRTSGFERDGQKQYYVKFKDVGVAGVPESPDPEVKDRIAKIVNLRKR